MRVRWSYTCFFLCIGLLIFHIKNYRYKRKNVKELYKLLHKCNEQLQQFSHVNKKALDQYVNFTEQREELQRRQAELDAGDEVHRTYTFSGIVFSWMFC